MKIVGSLFYMVINKRISEAVLNQLDMFRIKTLHADININVNHLSDSQFKVEMESMVLFNFVTIKLLYLELWPNNSSANSTASSNHSILETSRRDNLEIHMTREAVPEVPRIGCQIHGDSPLAVSIGIIVADSD